jgi:hypothetical protein
MLEFVGGGNENSSVVDEASYVLDDTFEGMDCLSSLLTFVGSLTCSEQFVR